MIKRFVVKAEKTSNGNPNYNLPRELCRITANIGQCVQKPSLKEGEGECDLTIDSKVRSHLLW